MLVVDVVVLVATRVPPDVLFVVLLYHSYFNIEPLPADALTDKAENTSFKHFGDCEEIEGCVIIVGNGFTLIAPDTGVVVVQLNEFVITAK